MIATDFEFDGEYLNNWGFMICSMDQDGFKSVNTDSKLSFNNVNLMRGKLFELIDSKYNSELSFSFHICKKSQDSILTPISPHEARELKRWLNRPVFKKFKLIQPYWHDIYMMGSFNVENVMCGGQIFLLNLTFTSNRPFALHEPITYRINTLSENETYAFFDKSDEIGYIYPNMKIICMQDGDLNITNSNENRITTIKNCLSGEEISFSENLTFSTTNSEHKIQNDFNYIFFRISNSYENRMNVLTFSIPVIAEITYSPYVKAVM